ncbi:MAG: hypothetical protein P8010_15220 [Desulfosarcinaceae bacterium]|jgi:hypothetical protein
MYSFFKALPTRRILSEQLPAFCGSLVIAEIFYKFHSFMLEALAFLATWYGLDWTIQWARKTLAGNTLVRNPSSSRQDRSSHENS